MIQKITMVKRSFPFLFMTLLFTLEWKIDTEDAGTQSSNSNNNARSKRNLRKRNADTTTLKTEPLSKRRAGK